VNALSDRVLSEVETILADIPEQYAEVIQEARHAVERVCKPNVSKERREDFLLGLKITANELWQEVVSVADLKKQAAEHVKRASEQVTQAEISARRIISDAVRLAEARANDAYADRLAAIEKAEKEIEQKKAELLQPFTQALTLTDTLLEKYGYSKKGTSWHSAVPSPVICWIGAQVMALCGTNPVTITNGQATVQSQPSTGEASK
jgi:hypothetical protein